MARSASISPALGVEVAAVAAVAAVANDGSCACAWGGGLSSTIAVSLYSGKGIIGIGKTPWAWPAPVPVALPALPTPHAAPDVSPVLAPAAVPAAPTVAEAGGEEREAGGLGVLITKPSRPLP